MRDAVKNNTLMKKIIIGALPLLTAIVSAFGSAAYTQNKVNTEVQVITESNGSVVKITKELTERAVVAEEEADSLKKELDKIKDDYDGLSNKNNLLVEENKQLKGQTVLEKNSEEESEQSVANLEDAIKLSELTEVSSEYYEKVDGFVDSYGNQYDTGYEFYTGLSGYATYSLQGKYTDFEAIIVAGEKTSTTGAMSISVYKDDEEIDKITGITKETETMKIGPYDLTGARRLTIKTSSSDGLSSSYCYLADAFVI